LRGRIIVSCARVIFEAAFPPLNVGIIAAASNLKTSVLVSSITSWLVCFILYLGSLFFINADIKSLRDQLKERAKEEKKLQEAYSLI